MVTRRHRRGLLAGARRTTCCARREPAAVRAVHRTGRPYGADDDVHFTSRKPIKAQQVAPISDDVPWGTPYVAGSPIPIRTVLPTGKYTLQGKASGSAAVQITDSASRTLRREASPCATATTPTTARTS